MRHSQHLSPTNIHIAPLTSERWQDFVELFGERGACGGCWCMWWKLKRAEFTKNKGPGNRRAMKKIVDSCETPGLIAFAGKRPVAWCAVAPREAFPVLDRSRILRRVDDAAVWSIVCFFVAKPYRQRGLQVELIKAAVKYAAKMGARIVEGYPMEPRKGLMPDAFAWTGLASAFRQAKFVDVARRSKTRPIMRFVIE